MQQDAMERLGLRQMLLEPELLAHRRGRRPPGRHPRVARVDHPRSARATPPAAVVPQGRRRARAPAAPMPCSRPCAARCRARRERAGRGCPTSTGTAPSARTCALRPRAPHGHRREARSATARRRSSLRDVILCVDQSGSMATSVVYASIFAAVLASLRALSHAAGRLRHRGRRPHRAARRSGRGPVRHAARRRHRHQPRRRLLPAAHHAAGADRLPARSPTSTKAATPTRCSRAIADAEGERRDRRLPAGAQRPGRADVRRRATPRRSRRSASPRSPARPTRSRR